MSVNWNQDTIALLIYVQPNAKEDRVVGLYQNYIKIQITALAIDNKANNYLKKWLSKQFDVPVSQINIEKGETSRFKKVHIIKPKILPKWLSDLS